MRILKVTLKILKSIFIVLGILLLLSALVLRSRVMQDVDRNLNLPNTYAIQNVQTGKDIRVNNADIKDGVKTVLFSHYNWGCMTWQFIQLEEDTYLLKNMYTLKSFEPVSSPGPGVELWQQPLGGTRRQYWEFIKQPDETYLIRLKDTELYVTVSATEDDSPIILMP
ncbi:MAG: RICIN domain-containing protein, partial [Spirochaetaceae bacterium]|nr:RICIN domain-containing protein [Spirochaetaceae bacterium]